MTIEEIDFPHGDIIDSRELIDVIDSDDETFAPEVLSEIEDASQYSADWEYGDTLIAKNYFVEYAQQLAEDIGAISSDAGWPLYCIDWEWAARELAMDYSLVTIDGREYYVRA